MYWKLAFTEGKWFVLALVILMALLAWVHPWLMALPLAALLFVFYFFRDPVRQPANAADTVLAPADGTVTAVATTDCEYVGQQAWEVSIFMSPFDVHVNRSPIQGKLESVRHFPGKFMPAMNPAAPLKNEKNIFLIRGDIPVKVTQIAGIVARRVVSWAAEGQQIKQGEKIGMIKFSSCTQVVFPSSWVVRVKEGDKVTAGLTVVGEKQ